MSNLDAYYRERFDQPTRPTLAQLKSLLRIWQSQGNTKELLPFLLLLESVLEQGDAQETLRTKFLHVLQSEIAETNTEKHVSEQPAEITIAAAPDPGTYTIFGLSSKETATTTAQDLLDIAAWVEQHRDQLRKEAGQELTSYRVQLHISRIRPVNSPLPEYSFEAANAQEAAGRALFHHGARQMKIVVVISAAKEEGYADVELQQDRSITFGSTWEKLLPQPLPGEER